jgi:hypothetical protein
LRAFRVDSVFLRDPHLFANPLGCADITEIANTFIATELSNDSEPDGYLDLSLLAVFPNLNQPPAPGGNIDIQTAQCTVPVGAEVCSPDGPPAASTTYVNQSGGSCVAAVPGTTGPNNSGGYTPSVGAAIAPCAASVPTTLIFPLGLFDIPLEDVQVGATYVGNPATVLANGVIRGFISEATADALILPPGVPLVAGQPLSALFAGGATNCSPNDDRDIGPSSEPGWYIYLNFTAHAVTWNP